MNRREPPTIMTVNSNNHGRGHSALGRFLESLRKRLSGLSDQEQEALVQSGDEILARFGVKRGPRKKRPSN